MAKRFQSLFNNPYYNAKIIKRRQETQICDFEKTSVTILTATNSSRPCLVISFSDKEAYIMISMTRHFGGGRIDKLTKSITGKPLF